MPTSPEATVEIVLSAHDLELLKHKNTIAALQSRNGQLQELLQAEKEGRRIDSAKHARVVRELNRQIANDKTAEHIKMLEDRHQSLSETCDAYSQQMSALEKENLRLRARLTSEGVRVPR